MDVLCLIGICDAAAQAAGAVAAVASAASSTEPAASGALVVASEWQEELGFVVTFFALICVLLAQLLANPVIRRYEARLLRFMGTASQQALGLAGREAHAPWTATSLLAALEHKRRAVLVVLIGVVLAYSMAATAVLIVNGLTHVDKKGMLELGVAVSLLMFVAFSGPVVLLGVAVSNFGKLFWAYFAPLIFAAVAMQAVIKQRVDTEESRALVITAIGAVALITLAAVALRFWLPRRLRQAATSWLRRHRWLGGLLSVIVAILVLAAIGAWMDERSVEYFVAGCMAGLAAIVLCNYTMIDRIRRIVTPLLAAGLFAVFAAIVGMLAAAGSVADDWITLVLVLATLPVSWLAWNFMLSWVGLAYEQKLFSDAQFQVFCWMITICGVVICVQTFAQEDDEVKILSAVNLWLAAATVLALVVYWSAVRYWIKPLDSNQRLLVLRVFSKDLRGERLLDELEYRWRFIGPIVLIGGKDVAKRTIDPAKAANFLRRRLQDIFVSNRHVLHKRVAAMDETPDPDGRYRVNEFFCFDDIWKEAVELLLESSDAIVLDLSEFTAERQGTAFELGLLSERGALSRTIFLVSKATDRTAVHAALHLPPGASLPADSVIQVERSVDGKQLVEALVHRIPALAGSLDVARTGVVVAGVS